MLTEQSYSINKFLRKVNLTCCIPNIIFQIVPFLVVLNEKQRKAKRKLIEENREKRKQETTKVKTKPIEGCNHDTLTETDKTIIAEVTSAYEQTVVKVPMKENAVSSKCFLTWVIILVFNVIKCKMIDLSFYTQGNLIEMD